MAPATPRRVLVVDDSAVSRRLLSRAILSSPGLQIIAEAPDAFSAHALIAQHQPDLVTLDLELPQMDGLAFLRHLMANDPRPVIVVSSHTPSGSARSLEALRIGAADVILKPATPAAFDGFAQHLTRRIREAAGYRVQRVPFTTMATIAPAAGAAPDDGLIAIGASTGGPQALERLLINLPSNLAPIVIVQHMPAEFTRLLARHLDDACPMRIVEAQHREPLARGTAYIAPGGRHLTVEKAAGGGMRIALTDRPPVHYQRPSVDVMFHSVAKLQGIRAVGVLLTGMGEDGADGMVALRNAGQQTIAQDERTSLIFGMPRAAIERDAARRVVSLDHMPAVLVDCLRGDRTGRGSGKVTAFSAPGRD